MVKFSLVFYSLFRLFLDISIPLLSPFLFDKLRLSNTSFPSLFNKFQPRPPKNAIFAIFADFSILEVAWTRQNPKKFFRTRFFIPHRGILCFRRRFLSVPKGKCDFFDFSQIFWGINLRLIFWIFRKIFRRFFRITAIRYAELKIVKTKKHQNGAF